VTLARLLPALACLAFAPAALAEDQPLAADLVALVVGGFADSATVQIAPEPMVVTRTAAGAFAGKAESGASATMVVVETSPCVFDLVFTMADQVFPVRFDAGLVEAIAFVEGGDMGLAEGIKPWTVQFTGDENLAVRAKDDGTIEPLSGSPTIVTSVPLAELEAGAAKLKELCPTR
jgi:hypothetical protein